VKIPLLIPLLLLAGCVTTPAPKVSDGPPMPMPPKITVKRYAKTESPKAASAAAPRLLAAGSPTPAVPSWTFPALTASTNGTYRIDASTNLVAWWTVAIVYSTTNITITSDTVAKRSTMFYRVVPIN